MNNKDYQRNLILNENLWKVMWKMSLPAIIAMILYGMNTVFDAIFVGRFVGETALAGVSLAYPLSQIVLGIGSLFGVGAGSALSIAIGAKDKKTQERILGNVNYLSIISTVVYMIIGWFFAESFIKMMGGKGEAILPAVEYFRITIIGTIFWIHGLALNMVVRAEGKMKSAAVMMGSGLLINIIANYFLIVVFGFGVKGAAWGTNLGMFIYSLMGILYFSGKKATFEANPLKIYRDKKIINSIFSMGIPSFIMSVMSVLQGVVVFNALSKYGTLFDIAFYGVAFRIYTFLLTPIFGLMRALQPVTGINFGAGNNLRVIKSYKVFTVAGICFMIPFWIILMLIPSSVLNIMMPGQIFDPYNIMNFRILMLVIPILPIIFICMTFFPSINKGKPVAIIGIARQIVFYIPVMYFFPKFMGIRGIYFGSFLIDVIIVIWALLISLKEFKVLKNKNLKIQNEY
ncbi:putative MATE family efflux protein [Oceanotoga teriensis]|uniref:Multidrug export protein MepA n=2 Tax=Oceanotoga teriensis TaxID=515440 RepID=A0AA45C6N2_9BACT|nr:MATE family efflux transporter [Oceanotoga teriensis]PWJ92173.1 putative MATE family efflux protein [Oceanotoga teriensis]